MAKSSKAWAGGVVVPLASSTPSAPPEFAPAGLLVAQALRSFRPAERIGLADFAEQNRVLINAGGYVGSFTFDPIPWMREVHDSLGDARYNTTCLVGPGQCSKTTAAENWLFHSIVTNPAKMLWYLQNSAAVQSHVKDVIDPMIEQHAGLRDRLGVRPIDNSLGYKRFSGMAVEFLAATPANLVNKKGAFIVADEIDAWKLALGNPKELLDVRRQAQGSRSKLFVLSHPDRALGLDPKLWAAGIMAIYADSTRKVYYWPCQHCGAHCSPCPGSARYMELVFDREGDLDAVADSARLLCPVCGALLDDTDRVKMNRAGGHWIGLGQTISEDGVVAGELVENKTDGFWVVGAMSEFTMGGIAGLARSMVQAERQAEETGDDATVKEVACKRFGFPHDSKKQGKALDPEALQARAEDFPLGVVPEGARFITMAADVQAGRFVVQAEAWGVDLERWIFDRFEIVKSKRLDADQDPLPLDPAGYPEDWDCLFDEMLARTYPLADGSGRHMRVLDAGVDSAGETGVTANAYDAWRRIRKLHNRRLTLFKGDPRGTRFIQRRFPNSQRQDRNAGARGEIPVFFVSALHMGDALAAMLQRTQPGPRYIHFSNELPRSFYDELTAEERERTGWVKTRERNESWDLAKYNHALALLRQAAKIDWSKPPSWAAPWDENSLVFDPQAEKPITNGVREKQDLVDLLA